MIKSMLDSYDRVVYSIIMKRMFLLVIPLVALCSMGSMAIVIKNYKQLSFRTPDKSTASIPVFIKGYKKNFNINIGVGQNYITPKLAKLLQLVPAHATQYPKDLKGLIKKLQLSNKFTAKNIPVVLNINQDTNLLSNTFFRTHKIIISYFNHSLYLPRKKNAIFIPESTHFINVSLQMENDHSFIPVAINAEKSAKFLVDNEGLTIVSTKWATDHHLIITKKCMNKSVLYLPRSIKLCHVTGIKSLNIGIKQVSTTMPDKIWAANLDFITPNSPVQGVLGGDWMKKNKVIIDLNKNTLWIYY